LADLAVLRFNTRGTSSPHGTSQGSFDDGVAEKGDVAAAMEFVQSRKLPHPWLVGWSFGTELAIKYGRQLAVDGTILLSPPLHRSSEADLRAWADDARPFIVIVPEFDDYLRPDEARSRFMEVPHARIIGVEGGKHLWVGEKLTYRVLTEIVKAVNPAALPLPTEYAFG
jgi:alpha/beta superfamily hydrolase